MDFSISSQHAAATNFTRVGWVDEPRGRGTIGILFTCLTTLLVCSWSVTHLNIPSKASGYFAKCAWQLYWGFLCILGPELVIWTAWRQWLAARALRESLTATMGSFSMTQGYFAVMGGFAFDVPTAFYSPETPISERVTRVFLTCKGVALLADCGYLPSISDDEIQDKSKKDGIGKAIACMQAGWMIAQVISRLALDLPVTLLEVATLGHVVCAFALFTLWWDKPQRVEQPIILKGEWTYPLIAFMLAASDIGGEQTVTIPGFNATSNPPLIVRWELHNEGLDDDAASLDVSDKVKPIALDGSWSTRPKDADDLLDSEIRYATFPEPDSKGEHLIRQLVCRALERFEPCRALLRKPIPSHDLKFETALATYPEMPESCKARQFHIRISDEPWHLPQPTWFQCDSQHLVTRCVPDWPHDGLKRTTGGLFMGTTLWLVSIIFGAVHIAAWNSAFPTAAEAWLWRCSSVYVAFSGILWAGLHILAEHLPRLWWFWYDFMIGEAPVVLQIPITVTCGVCGVLYILARAYLVVEGFVELRLLPQAAYVAPQWTLNAPHVG